MEPDQWLVASHRTLAYVIPDILSSTGFAAAQQLDGADPASCGLGLSRSILELAGRLISRPLGAILVSHL